MLVYKWSLTENSKFDVIIPRWSRTKSKRLREKNNWSTAVCTVLQLLTSQVGANLGRGQEAVLRETGQAYALGQRTEEYHNAKCDVTATPPFNAWCSVTPPPQHDIAHVYPCVYMKDIPVDIAVFLHQPKGHSRNQRSQL